MRNKKTVLIRLIKLRIFTVVFFGFYCFFVCFVCFFILMIPRDADANRETPSKMESLVTSRMLAYTLRGPGFGSETFICHDCILVGVEHPKQYLHVYTSIFHIPSNQFQFPIFRKWSNRNPPNFPTNRRRIHGHQNHLPTASSIFQLRFKKAPGKHIGTKCQEEFHTFWANILFFW